MTNPQNEAEPPPGTEIHPVTELKPREMASLFVTKRAGRIKRLDALYERLKAAGFRVQGTRLDLYRKTFYTIDKFITENREQELNTKVGIATLVNDLHESHELLEACDEFPDLTQAGLRDRLKKALNGPRELEKETPEKGEPRNFLFELVMASLLKRAGFAIDLDRTEDVFFQLAGRPVFMECKRIHSLPRLEKRIEDATLQIRERCDGTHASEARGIIAIDVSRLLNPGDGFFEASTSQDLFFGCTIFFENFLAMQWPRLQDLSRRLQRKERRVLGLYVYGRLPGWVRQPSGQPLGVYTCRESHFIILHDRGSKDAKHGRMFYERIKLPAMHIK
jgi:hypothetical protein